MTHEKLPILSILPDILKAVKERRDIVLTAPTGSGKSTQVPQALLDDHPEQRIIVVQPRRIACRAVAERVARERNIVLGGEVGYVVRYDKQRTMETRLLFVTDGVLLRMLETNPGLPWADVVIFDEFHERRASMDLALGLLKRNRRTRKKPTVIVMSATMACEEVARYLNAVSLHAEGRSFPVEIHQEPAATQEEAIKALPGWLKRIDESGVPGDVLVFLSGKREIFQATRLLGQDARFVILPLHGELPPDQQDLVFWPMERRKVILATNVAETSLTIPGVRTVIDTGFERRATFDPHLRVQRLDLVRISKASADQRAGRAGREGPGQCIRLWSGRVQQQLEDRPKSEIQTSDLGTIILTLKAGGVEDAAAFDFLEEPAAEQFLSAERFLQQLEALDAGGNLTDIGRQMARLPISPRFARMVIEGERRGCLAEMVTVAAFLSSAPCFPSGRFAPQVTRPMISDLEGLLDTYHARRAEEELLDAWCEEQGIDPTAWHGAELLRRKLLRIAFDRGAILNRNPASMETIQFCILTGLVDRFAKRGPSGAYRLPNGMLCRVRGSEIRSDWVAAIDVHQTRTANGSKEPEGILSILTVVPEEQIPSLAPWLQEAPRKPEGMEPVSPIPELKEKREAVLSEPLRNRLASLSPAITKLLGKK